MHVYFRFIHSNDRSALLEPPLDLFGGMYSIIVLQSRIVINISIKKNDAVNVFWNILLQTTLKRKVKVKALNQQEVKGQIKVIAVEGQGLGDRGSEWGNHDNRYPLWLPWIQLLICELIYICMAYRSVQQRKEYVFKFN